jgi:hypothetical protein
MPFDPWEIYLFVCLGCMLITGCWMFRVLGYEASDYVVIMVAGAVAPVLGHWAFAVLMLIWASIRGLLDWWREQAVRRSSCADASLRDVRHQAVDQARTLMLDRGDYRARFE